MRMKTKHIFIMKTKLQILVTVLSIVFLVARASGQQTALINSPPPPPRPVPIDPQTGLPESGTDIDPATGLPADGSPPFKDANGSATWIDPAWKDSDKILPSFSIPGWPVTEAVNRLREQFTNDFDIILPSAIPGFDPSQVNVDLELKNVKASEIFSAMNLQFELNQSPLRWELTLNGSRPTAILRNLPRLGPPPPPAPPQIRKVFSVAYMLGDYPGTNDLDKLNEISYTIIHVWGETGVRVGTVNTYPPGQLLIISGTADQVDLAEQTLRELGHKADYDHGNSHTLAQPANP
jgi:hypothetical protein